MSRIFFSYSTSQSCFDNFFQGSLIEDTCMKEKKKNAYILAFVPLSLDGRPIQLQGRRNRWGWWGFGLSTFLPKWAWFCLRERLYGIDVVNYDYLIFHTTIDFVYQTQISILFNLFTLSIYINLWKSTCIQCFFFFPVYFTFTTPPCILNYRNSNRQ